MVITADVVKLLRERTGAGVMDCKEALAEAKGDMDAAAALLRKKGIAKAERKMGRRAEQGVVYSYIHPGSRIGVLVEVNCETDFVAKTDKFVALARDIAMQIAATNPLAVRREQVDPAILERERSIFQAQAESTGKPAAVVAKIAEGRLEKFFQESCLLEQTFIRDSGKTVSDIVKEAVASLGENIAISRFSRFEVGSGPTTNGSF